MYRAYRIHRGLRKSGGNEETVIFLEPLSTIDAECAEAALDCAKYVYPQFTHQLCIGEYHAAPAPQAQ